MRILYFLPDGHGSVGGIAQFNRDLLMAIGSIPTLSGVIALPRHMATAPEGLPRWLTYDLPAARGKLRYLQRVFRLLLRDRRFDLIICTHLNLQPIAWFARWLTGAPTMLILHGTDAWTAPRSPLRRYAAQRADWHVAVSRLTLDRFRQWAKVAPERCAVLPCCVDTNRFSPRAADPAIVEKYRLAGKRPVLTMARLAGSERYKGFDEVIEVLARVRATVPNVLYVIAGSGDDRARLEAKVRSLGLEDCVSFAGYVPEADKPDLYRAAHAFILAGRGEGFGIVLLEAIACGVPVVASTVDGSFEAIGEGRLGIAVDPTDPDALQSAILAALDRPVGVVPAALEQFSVPTFQSRVRALVSRVLAGDTTTETAYLPAEPR